MPSVEMRAATPSRAFAWLALGRVSNLPTVASNTVAGAAVAAAVPAGGRVAVVAVACSLFYVAGMVLNDLLDLDFDRVHRRERPLVTGAVTPRAAALATAGLFIAGAALLGSLGAAEFAGGLALIALIWIYDAWHKGNPLSPLLMAGTRVLVYLLAFLALDGSDWSEIAIAAAVLAAYVMGLTQVAKVAAGDRWPGLVLLVPALAYAVSAPSAAALLAAGVLVAWTGWTLRSLYAGSSGVGATVHRLIAGLCLVDAVVLAVSGAPVVAFAVVATAFAATLALQRHVPGT